MRKFKSDLENMQGRIKLNKLNLIIVIINNIYIELRFIFIYFFNNNKFLIYTTN